MNNVFPHLELVDRKCIKELMGDEEREFPWHVG